MLHNMHTLQWQLLMQAETLAWACVFVHLKVTHKHKGGGNDRAHGEGVRKGQRASGAGCLLGTLANMAA